MKLATLALLAVAAALASGCDLPVMTRFEYDTVKLEVGGRVLPAQTKVASLRPPGTFYMMLDTPPKQVVLDVRLVDVRRDQFLLDVGLWLGGEQVLRPMKFEDTTPHAPAISLGFGLGTEIGGHGDRHAESDRRGSRGTGVGTGISVPITGGADDRVTSARLTFEPIIMSGGLDGSYVVIIAAIGRHMNGQIIARPFLVPLEITPDPKAAAERQRNLPRTHAVVHENNTYVLAGLLADDSQVGQQVPALNDIPLLNRLFRPENDRLDRTELIIFITPRILLREDE